MSARITNAFAIVLASLLCVVARADDAKISLGEALPNVLFPEENRIVSGAIDAEDIAVLQAAGIKHVIDLRAPEEHPDLDEARLVEEHGMTYHVLPIKGAESLTRENARELARLLDAAGDDMTIVHCSSGNRVGALIALREAWIENRSAEEAIAEGKRWGLTRLEPSVRELLE